MASRVLPGSRPGQTTIVSDASGAFVLPGVAVVAGKRALILIASAGSFADTGEPATFGRTRVSAFAYGAFALTGGASAAALVEPVSVGAFALTGKPAGLLFASPGHISAAYGVFAVTGELAGLLEGHKAFEAYGAFTLTGEAAGLQRSRGAALAYGGFSLTGEPAGLLKSLPRSMPLAPAGFDLDGMASFRELNVGFSLGAFNLSGGGAVFYRGLPLAGGSFTLVGELSLRRIVARMAGAPIALTGFASSISLVEPIVAFGSFALTGGVSTQSKNTFLYPGLFEAYGKTSFRKFGGPSLGGAFSLAGGPIELVRGRGLPVASGSYTEAGGSAAILRNRMMELMAGDISLSGQRSGTTVVRLGGVPGVGAIVWAAAAKPNVKWIS